MARPDRAETIRGEVVRVIDGDTLEVDAPERGRLRIRLAQIDAPESTQPHGARSTDALSKLTLGEQVRVDVVDVDRYGRTVGEIWIDTLHVNAEMIRRGHAWAYTKYAKSAEVINLEDEARSANVGLWRLPASDREAPWTWRKNRRTQKTPHAEPLPRDTVCGDKRTCKQMVSCAEAKFYLVECGRGRLDGDKDGVPCESICRR